MKTYAYTRRAHLFHIFNKRLEEKRKTQLLASYRQLHVYVHTQTLFKPKHFMQEQECKAAKVVSHCFSLDMASSLNHILCRICETRSFSPPIKIFMTLTAGFQSQCVLFHSKKPRREKNTLILQMWICFVWCVQQKKRCFLTYVVQKTSDLFFVE